MTQSKHTPGPWVIDEVTECGQAVISSKNMDWIDFARVWVMSSGEPDREGKANARLIAESPTMHELLLKLQAVRSPRDLHNLRCEVAEVLARIEGAN